MKLKKKIVTGISIIIAGSIGLFYSNVLQPPFIHINDGKRLVNPRGTDSIYIYTEDILVAHPPKDTLERMKMMVNYYDTVGVSLADLKKQGDITFYFMGFVKNTCATRKFHLEKQRNVECNSNETYIGSICITRITESLDKWKISISYNLGAEPDADYIGCKTKDYILYDERDSNFYERHKDDEIVRYYHELQERKRHTKSEPKSEQEISIYHIDKVKNRTISSEDRKTKIELPFDFREYQLWQDKYDMGEIEERLYFPVYFENDSLLTEHYFKKWNGEDIIPSFYYNFVTDKTDGFILQCICGHLKKKLPSLIYQIATWNGNSYIDGITCFKSIEDHDWKEQSFRVSKDLEILLYHNRINDDASIIKQDITAKYVINSEGKFIQVEQ